MDPIKLLNQEVEKTSQGKVAKELGISKTSVNLLLKSNYPNPKKMYKKIVDRYGSEVEIIGAEVKNSSLADMVSMMEEL